MVKMAKITKSSLLKKLPKKHTDWRLALMSGQELRIG
jgi:hypothetical protein